MSRALEWAASGEAAKAGPLGLLVILVLCVACYFLFKSMSKHLRTVREDFPTVLPPDPLHPTRALIVEDDEPVTAADPGEAHEPAPSDPATLTDRVD